MSTPILPPCLKKALWSASQEASRVYRSAAPITHYPDRILAIFTKAISSFFSAQPSPQHINAAHTDAVEIAQQILAMNYPPGDAIDNICALIEPKLRERDEEIERLTNAISWSEAKTEEDNVSLRAELDDLKSKLNQVLTGDEPGNIPWHEERYGRLLLQHAKLEMELTDLRMNTTNTIADLKSLFAARQTQEERNYERD